MEEPADHSAGLSAVGSEDDDRALVGVLDGHRGEQARGHWLRAFPSIRALMIASRE
jgi:hypothetical protein